MELPMPLKKLKYSVIASATVLLAACGDSALDKKTGAELYQDATQNLYASDAQFNFNANITVDSSIENPLMTDLKVKVSGAVNNTAKRYELIPEVEAAIFNFKLPIAIDGKKNEVLIDTANFIDATLMFVPQARNELQQYKNKFVRFSPNNFEINKDDMATAIIIMSEAAKIGSSTMDEMTRSIPESSIVKLPLDDKAKQLQAKAVLKVSLDRQQGQVLQKQLNTYIYDQVVANEKLPEDFKESFAQALLEADNETGFESSESVMYLNEKGYVVHDSSVMNYDIEGEQVSIGMQVDYSGYGKARFTINPDENQVIEFTEENMRSLQRM